MASSQSPATGITKITNMGQRYLSRWVSWSGSTTPPTSPSRASPVEGNYPVSPQPPRLRSRTSSKASNASDKAPSPYPLLSKLPVPPLGHTLTWHLCHLRPILNPDDFHEAEKLAIEFGNPNGIGEKLQEELIKRHDSMETWAYQWWLDDMYLHIPLPLPANSNPGMVFPRQNFASSNDMLQFAARLVVTSLNLKERIDLGDLEVDRCSARERYQPLCMAQYGRVFTSYRRPAIPKDKLISLADLPKENQHIIVIHKNHMYKVEVVNGGMKISIKELTDYFSRILKDVEDFEGPDPPPVGVMTSDNRRTWAQNRQILLTDPSNKKSIDALETCVLVLCIDSPLPSQFNLATRTSHKASLNKRTSNLNAVVAASTTTQELTSTRDEVNAGHQMIHGGGSNHNAANRWFDKTVQFIVTPDGWCGLCYEHSCAEGIVMIQLVEQVLLSLSEDESKEDLQDGRISSNDVIPEERSEDTQQLTKLEWSISPVLDKRIQESCENIDKLVSDLDFRILRYAGYGRDMIKDSKCSPDAFIQIALQLAYFRTHGKLCSTYESASTRRFRQGRVDCIRANTVQVLSWCETMVLNANMSEKVSKFDNALATQTEIMVNNILGRGIDIHLLGLREMARELSLPLPELFAHSSYQEACHFKLSTSQVPTLSDSWMGYGPVCPDGYGASYNPHPDSIVFCLSAFNSCQQTSTLEFGRNLERALDEMKCILDAKR